MQLRNARAAVFILLLALLPIYWARTVRWTELADLSASVIAQLENEISRLPEGSTIVIVDDETTRANLTNAWAGLTREVSQVAFGGHINIELRRASDRQRAEPAGGELVMLLHQGRLARLP